jgi:hypothetical protein
LPTPSSIPSPTATFELPIAFLPTPGADRSAPTDVPACKDVQVLEQPIQFSWPGLEDVAENAPETNWTYYRCGQSQAAASAFYRHWMSTTEYHWVEYSWDEGAGGTLGVFYSSSVNLADPNRWLYLWFLPEQSSNESSYLVAAWWSAAHSC